jgi:iron complex transport system substrate-binding protein
VRKIAFILLALIIVAAVCSSCSSQATVSATIIDDLGRPISIKEIPERIVSLAPSATEILYALDLGDKIVGVTDHCDYPEEAQEKPKMGGYFTTSLETIVAEEPDIIITDGHDPVCQQLENLDIPMVVLQPKDIFGVLRDIELVGEITGKEQKAKELTADLETRINAVAEKTSQVNEKTRVFYEIDASDLTKPWTSGSGSFIHGLITIAGAINIVEASGDWVQLSLEELINTDPDMIILGDYPFVSPEDVKQRPGAWQQLTAVINEEIYSISDPDLTSRSGPRIIDGLEELARIIYPALFE